MFNTPFPQAFGLDISDRSIKLVQLRNYSLFRREGRFELLEARSVSIPPGLVVEGVITEPEPIRKYIKHLINGKKKKDRITSPWVVVSVPEKQSFLKLLTIKKPLTEITIDDVLFEGKQHIPFEKDGYYMDWQIVPNKKTGETKVLMSVCSKQTADMYTYLLESVGLGVTALEVESLAIARAMVTAKKKYNKEARAILDIGASQSILVIYDNNTVQFSTVLNYCGDKVTKALQDSLHISQEEAEKIKQRHGINLQKKSGKEWAAMIKTVHELSKEVDRAIRFYYSHFPQANRITHVTMSGGGSVLKGLDHVLQTELNISVRPGLPWKNLAPKKLINVKDKKALGYATAIGLALRAADNPFFRNDSI